MLASEGKTSLLLYVRTAGGFGRIRDTAVTSEAKIGGLPATSTDF
jgi:hypothetical protein